jgi:predicted secreted protein
MGIVSGIVVYILIWWIVIFCTLPFNIRPLDNNADGSMPGAPVDPGLKKKVILTSVISLIIWGVVYLIVTSGLISYREIVARMDL